MATSGGLQAGGGGMSFPAFSGSGSPEGVQVGAVGQYYLDVDSGLLYAKVDDDGGDSGWMGPLRLGETGDSYQADDQTTITCDGDPVTVDWIVSAPPEWADDAGNITTPGLYEALLTLSPVVSPTVPTLFLQYAGAAGIGVVALGALDYAGTIITSLTFSVTVGFPPVTITSEVQGQTDVTATVDARLRVTRLAYNVP